MPQLVINLSSFTNTNVNLTGGGQFNCTASGSTVANAYVTGGTLYLSNIKTWGQHQHYLKLTWGGTVFTTGTFPGSDQLHSETVALATYDNTLLSKGSGTINCVVMRSLAGQTLYLAAGLTGKLTINYEYNYTVCAAPSAVAVNANNVAPGQNVTLSWSGAAAGASNAITGYQIYRATSATGTYSLLTTVSTSATSGSTTVAAPSTSGSSYYYKVLTVGTVSGYSSGQSSAYATLSCLCTAVTAPTSVSISAGLVNAGASATLSWSGASAGTNNAIAGYTVYRALAAAGTYEVLGTATGTSFSVTANATQGASYYYKVLTRGAVSGFDSGLSSAYATLKTNTAPTAPAFTAPVSGGTTYNPRPRLLVTVGTDADGHTQTLACAGYSASSTGALAAGRKIVFGRSADLTAAGSQSVTVTVTDTLGAATSSAARSISYAVPVFTDTTLSAGGTFIKAIHMNELRTMVNNVRAYYGLAAYAWSATIAGGVTSLAGWKNHVLELRTAIEQIVTLVNGWDTTSATHNITLPVWIDIPANKPTVAVMNQLRAVIPLL